MTSGLSVVYLRLPWYSGRAGGGEVQLVGGGHAAQRWIAEGKRIAFRFSACEELHALRHAGGWRRRGRRRNPAKGRRAWTRKAVLGARLRRPVFLAKLDGFLAAAAARYDGQPGGVHRRRIIRCVG
jgi:hypothetical protein